MRDRLKNLFRKVMVLIEKKKHGLEKALWP